MTQALFGRRALPTGAVAVLLALVAVAPARAAGPTTTDVDTSGCSATDVFQPFLGNKDKNWYWIAPGQSPDGFQGDGWTLANGARTVTTTRADGSQGKVLDLPSGATAVSPPMCVTHDMPTARTRVRNLAGAEGVQFSVSYAGTPTWDKPKNTGQFHGEKTGWTLSNNINLQPQGGDNGWQIARFTLVGGGRTSDFQVYDFWVDPRMRG